MAEKRIVHLSYIRFFSGILVLGLAFFLPAGTLNYWEAWVFIAILFTPMFFIMQYLIKNDPALLERRARSKEQASEQNLIVKLSFVYYIVTYLLPGFDKRYGWSDAPLWLVVTAQVVVFLGYFLVTQVFKENSYASRTVEVDEDQKVIDTGPYAVVRHPMYVGVGALYLLSPLALGSTWGLLSSVLIIPLLIARIISEERILAKELKGYTEYQHKVKYRLIPGIW